MKLFWNIAGLLAFILGACGLFLPILPTTPLWLLAGYCLMKGSQGLYNRLMSIRLFNIIVTNFRQYRAIPKRIKITSISILWITIIISCIMVNKWWITLMLIAIAGGATWHILSYRTLTDEEYKQMQKELNDKK